MNALKTINLTDPETDQALKAVMLTIKSYEKALSKSFGDNIRSKHFRDYKEYQLKHLFHVKQKLERAE